MSGVVLDKISKKFDKVQALDNISMEIEEGSFVCLLGPPGGGKTTMLKIIAGLETPDNGRVRVGNEDYTNLTPNMRDVSMVFQDFALYPHMSVFKNIASPLEAKKVPRHDIEQKVQQVAKFLKIDRFLDRKVTQLSGGEMQRVAIGRALAKEAKIVLFDEIFVNLDYKLREEMRVEFKELVDRLKITTIFSSPDPEDALSLADKVAMVNKGKIVQYDKREIVHQYPVDVFTGSYFGHPEMNLLDCRLGKTDGHFILDWESFKIPFVPRENGKKALSEGEYTLGIRPEDVQITEQKGIGIAIQGKMLLTEVIGSDTIVHVGVGTHTIQSFVPGIHRSVSDKAVYLGFETKDIYLFDRKTGLFAARGA